MTSYSLIQYINRFIKFKLYFRRTHHTLEYKMRKCFLQIIFASLLYVLLRKYNLVGKSRYACLK